MVHYTLAAGGHRGPWPTCVAGAADCVNLKAPDLTCVVCTGLLSLGGGQCLLYIHVAPAHPCCSKCTEVTGGVCGSREHLHGNYLSQYP